MKKNISINISGIIFHIEEDGYDMLRKYLDSVNRYFSNFEDSTEILADIEGRIAEIFLAKLNDAKQVITVEDVNALMGIMGSVSDFKAAEENDLGTETSGPAAREYSKSESHTHTSASSETQAKATSAPKRLYRDQKRKILGGVCAGLANYFSIDAVWIRLIFALLIFAYGAAFLLYIILWIAVPESYDLDEPTDTKKMYRDPETKVLGGVAAGVAAYFGTDVVLIRVLLLVSIFFFGTGILLYIVLWIVLPEAKTMTERMQMQGEPVTLSNIESNIKKNINEDPNKEESALTKILLLPFRILAAVLTGLGKILVPIVEVMRVAIGIFISFMALIMIFCGLFIGGFFLGIFSSLPGWISLGNHPELNFPIEAFTNTFPPFAVITAFIAFLIPAVIILLLGISIVAKRIVFGAATGWTLFAIFFACVAILSVMVPRIIYTFKESGEHKVESVYTPTGKTAVLKIHETGLDDYHATHLTLKGYEGNTFKLVQRFQAQGVTVAEAITNAQMIDYNVALNDSVFTFDSNIRFKEGATFRAQELEMTLYIPYDYPFVMDERMCRFITQYVSWDDMDDNTWRMTSRGLECLTCEGGRAINYNNDWDFDEIEISGYVDVTITQDDQFAVELVGSNDEKAKYTIEQSGRTLVIKYNEFDDRKEFNWRKEMTIFDEVEISISMPSLEKIQAKGAGKVNFSNFVSDDVELELLGAFRSRGQLTAHHVLVDIKGASELELSGETNNLEATISGASRLKAYDFETKDAIIETIGVSSARVSVSGILEMKEGVGSSINYRGNPAEIKKNN